MTFLQATRVEGSPPHFTVDFPTSWNFGEGVYGGAVLGALARSVPHDRPLRSLSVQLLGRVQPGHATIEVEPLRSGRTVNHHSLRLLQSGRLCAVATAASGIDRAADLDFHQLLMPELPRWRDDFELADAPHIPEFAQHFRYQPGIGVPMLSGSELASTGGWIRALDEPVDRPLLAGMSDAWWPALLGRLHTMRETATLQWTGLFLASNETLTSIAEQPIATRIEASIAASGYVCEDNLLWSQQGQPLLLARQTVVVLD